MITQKELQRIMQKAGESMIEGGNLDINLVASELRTIAEKYYYLLEFPEMRPMQDSLDRIVRRNNPS